MFSTYSYAITHHAQVDDTMLSGRVRNFIYFIIMSFILDGIIGLERNTFTGNDLMMIGSVIVVCCRYVMCYVTGILLVFDEYLSILIQIIRRMSVMYWNQCNLFHWRSSMRHSKFYYINVDCLMKFKVKIVLNIVLKLSFFTRGRQGF